MPTSTPTMARPASACPDLELLAIEARRLWSEEPPTDSRFRQELLTDLALIELDLERLALRALRSGLDDVDLVELASCTERLGQLQAHWRPR